MQLRALLPVCSQARAQRTIQVDFIFKHAVIPWDELLWRFGLAAAFGALLGLDREARGKAAGIRTHMLVALSSAMTMLIALELMEELSLQGKSPDPTRAIQGLAQAIGFLCAGVIFVARGNVHGLTTAASLWMTSAVGIAAGAGMTQIAAVGVGFALVILTVILVAQKALGLKEPQEEVDDAGARPQADPSRADDARP
jgi:putative Mg2+ transporter-C (MgtC) family protein